MYSSHFVIMIPLSHGSWFLRLTATRRPRMKRVRKMRGKLVQSAFLSMFQPRKVLMLLMSESVLPVKYR